MPRIDQLSTIASLSSGDLVPVYAQSNGDARAAPMSAILAFVENNFASPDYQNITVAPLDGFTIELDKSTKSIWLILSPAAGLTLGTIVLPEPADCFDGQTIVVTSSEAIAGLVVNGNGGTVNGAPSAIAADGFFSLRFHRVTSTWWCVAQSLGSVGILNNPILIGSFLDTDGDIKLSILESGDFTAPDENNWLALVYAKNGGEVAIAAQGDSTDIPLTIRAKGAGRLDIGGTLGGVQILAGGTSDVEVYTNDGDIALETNAGNARVKPFGNLELSTTGTGSTVLISTADSTITLTPGNGVVQANGGVRQPGQLFTNLPSAAGRTGERRFCSDSNTATFNAVVAGGGSNKVPVFSDGTDWRVG